MDRDAVARALFDRIYAESSSEMRAYIDLNPCVLSDGRYSLIFSDHRRGLLRLIVHRRVFLDFPGIDERDLPVILANYEEGLPIPEEICFGWSADRVKDGFVFLWVIQPDGRYYEDEDGFGGESQEEITLFARMDGNGAFVTQFRLCEIGVRRYADPFRDPEAEKEEP